MVTSYVTIKRLFVSIALFARLQNNNFNVLHFRYPQHNFIYDQDQVMSTSYQASGAKPFAMNFLIGIRDAHFMLRCQYIVATLSSNYARLLNELMLSRHHDGALRFKSLDAPYHAHGFNNAY